jgi:hypothetical protein
MKIRNGFVSNSSSSSFIILLPDNFDINSIDFDAEVKKNNYYECEGEDVKKTMTKLIKKKYLFEQEDGYDECSMIEEIFNEYIIAQVDGGPDEGQIILADNIQVKKILGI